MNPRLDFAVERRAFEEIEEVDHRYLAIGNLTEAEPSGVGQVLLELVGGGSEIRVCGRACLSGSLPS